jgi:D-alanine transaminase
MGRVAYVNGRYIEHSQAVVHVEDRGFQFADAVYEVWAVFDGKLADCEGHFNRLDRSLSELAIDQPMSRAALRMVIGETLRRNRIKDGMVYLQISRGVAKRDHAFPDPAPLPTLVLTAKSINYDALNAKAAKGVSVITQPDIRWGRCDIKTVGLLPNAMAKTLAHDAGAEEAWLVDEMGLVTEGASTNAWIVDASGTLRTRDTQANILRGITRAALIERLKEQGIPFSEKPFSVEEAKGAKEAFLTAASAFVLPIVQIDNITIGNGRPGPLSLSLRSLYMQTARRTAS